LSVRYIDEKLIKADIYLYDGGKDNLGDGIDSAAVRHHFEQSKKDIYIAYKGVSL
jgi:hypothetical protein